jgi:hypothetical protein
MSFEPFGYRFEITSSQSPAQVEAIIRSRKKNWFDAKNGARGWIAGPFICLWFSAFDQYGPMLFGIISGNGFGTRVRGRAGSDLNGVVAFSLLIPLMAFVTYQLIAEGSASVGQLIVIGAVFLVGGPILYWAAHKDRRGAEPLARFLRETLTVSGRTPRRKSADLTISKGLTLNVGGEKFAGVLKPESIHDALVEVGEGSFIVLEAGPEAYIQTASRDGGYIIEKRAGNRREHFRAARPQWAPTLAKQSKYTFDFEEVRVVFMAYASAAPMPDFVTWESLDLKG